MTDPTADPSETPTSHRTPRHGCRTRTPTRPRRAARARRAPSSTAATTSTPERGPGLGCFRFQLVVLVFFIILTPLTVVWNWPSPISAALLFAVILLLLVTGQTIIFLLRLVAADRRGRRRPLASETKTVGELEDAGGHAHARDDSLGDDLPDDDPPPPPERDSPG